MTDFASLDLIEPIQRAIAAQNYTHPTPIQARAIPALLAGRDLLGAAQTGTGKTAAFALPVLQQLEATRKSKNHYVRALVLSPTRELAAQIADSFETYGAHLDLRVAVVFGGVSERPQIAALKRGVDILVACPGRLLDLMGRGFVDLAAVEHFVLDEADRMLDMGFIHDIRKVIKALPGRRQNLLFSATMPEPIVELSRSFLRDPVRVDIAPDEPTVDQIDQRLMYVKKGDKRRLMVDLLGTEEVERAIVFTRTKRGANQLCKQLDDAGFSAAPIHGNKSQNARERALDGFRDGTYQVLVATDVASRGIDVDEVSHVFNFELPNEPESYVHRIGRTGRAGRVGAAISLCDDSETGYLRDIERTIGQSITVDASHAYHDGSIASAPVSRGSKSRGGGRGSSRSGHTGGRSNRGGAPKRRRSKKR